MIVLFGLKVMKQVIKHAAREQPNEKEDSLSCFSYSVLGAAACAVKVIHTRMLL